MLIPEKKVKVISDVRVICDNQESRFNYFAWPTVAKLPDGRFAMVTSGYRVKHVCPFGKAVISYSSDEGETWTKAKAFIDTPLDDRDSGIAVSGNRVLLTSFNNSVAFQRQINDEENQNNPELHALIAEHLDTVDAPAAEERYLGSIAHEEKYKTFRMWLRGGQVSMLIDQPETIYRALPVLMEDFSAFQGRVHALHLYEFFPTRHILSVRPEK